MTSTVDPRTDNVRTSGRDRSRERPTPEPSTRDTTEGEVSHFAKSCDRFEWTVSDFFTKVTKKYLKSPRFRSNHGSWQMGLGTKSRPDAHESFATLNLWRIPRSDSRYQVRIGVKKRNGRDLEVSSCETDVDGFLEMRKFLVWPRETPFSGNGKLVPDGRITVFCELCCSSEKAKEALRLASSSTNLLIQNFEDLFVSGINSDVEMTVEGKTFKAHKAILSARCPVFASMFQHDMKENNSGIVDIPDCSANAFEAYLRYLYTGRVDEYDPEQTCSLYYIADKYNSQELKERCTGFLDSYLSVDCFCDVVALALRHGESDLLESACNFFIENVKLIIKTPQWQKYVSDNPIHANELYIKAIDTYAGETWDLRRP